MFYVLLLVLTAYIILNEVTTMKLIKARDMMHLCIKQSQLGAQIQKQCRSRSAAQDNVSVSTRLNFSHPHQNCYVSPGC